MRFEMFGPLKEYSRISPFDQSDLQTSIHDIGMLYLTIVNLCKVSFSDILEKSRELLVNDITFLVKT